jgi:hypothetical protein
MCGSELHALPEGVQRVSRFLQDAGHPHAPQMLDGAARTAQEAADQLSILVGQVAKSIIFKRRSDGAAVLVVTSGDRRVDEKKVTQLVGKVGRADAREGAGMFYDEKISLPPGGSSANIAALTNGSSRSSATVRGHSCSADG